MGKLSTIAAEDTTVVVGAALPLPVFPDDGLLDWFLYGHSAFQ